MNQTLDFHKRSQAKFYETSLTPTIELSMSALRDVLSPPHPSRACFCRVVNLVIDMLSWEFEPRNAWTMMALEAQGEIGPGA